MSTDIKEKVDTEEEIVPTYGMAIVLHNDDFNRFEHVIYCLVKYCKHSVIQAEQCAHIVHYYGKTDVKRGDFDTLKPIKEALLENRLSATIEEVPA